MKSDNTANYCSFTKEIMLGVCVFANYLNVLGQIEPKPPIKKKDGFHGVKTNVVKLTTIPTLDISFGQFWNQSKMQNDIIGSDFYGKQEIGTACAERFGPNGNVWDFWFPLDINKKTIGGELISHKIYTFDDLGENLSDNDHNLHIIPTADYQSDFEFSIRKAVDRIDGNDDLVDDDVPNSACSEDDYRNFRIKSMEFEIDLHETQAKNYFNTNTINAPKIKSSSSSGDIVFAYGPWVSDAGHCHKPEIHPAEQIWWRKISAANKTSYYLLLSADQSHRFDVVDNFDDHEIVGQDRYLKAVWAPKPLKGTFAIVFGIKLKKERAYFDISRISGEGIHANYSEGQLHYLIYNQDTLVVVKEPSGNDQLKVSFQKVCLSNSFNQDGTTNIFGFVVLETEVGKGIDLSTFPPRPAKGGYQFLKVTEEIKDIQPKALPVTR